jgi:hypothetical protein
MAPAADAILNDEPHSVTLVFSDKLLAKQRLDFSFTWPKSLVRADGSCRRWCSFVFLPIRIHFAR